MASYILSEAACSTTLTEAAMCVRFSINQDNASVLFGVLWKRRVRGKTGFNHTSTMPGHVLINGKGVERCSSYSNASD